MIKKIGAVAVFTTAALLTPQVPATAVPEVKPAKQVAKRTWKSMTKAEHKYHCYHFNKDKSEYKRGYMIGAIALRGASPKRARALWKGWKWLLNKKCATKV